MGLCFEPHLAALATLAALADLGTRLGVGCAPPDPPALAALAGLAALPVLAIQQNALAARAALSYLYFAAAVRAPCICSVLTI